MNDPVVQTAIVGFAVNAAGAAIACYLWSEHRNERFLLFWALAWTTGFIRWTMHYPAESLPWLRRIEGFVIALTVLFMVLGSYDLLPSKPWRRRVVIGLTAGIILAYSIMANTMTLPIVMGYLLFAASIAFAAVCMSAAYRASRLTGYAIGAGTALYQLGVVATLLLLYGPHIANNIIVPLYNIPLILSIVVVAFQRRGRQLIESAEEMRQLYVRLANVEDDERRLLHAELHDQVGANLTALRLELDVAARLLHQDDLSNAERHLQSARGVVSETMITARDLMADLRPPALDDYGLIAALRTFGESHSARLNLHIVVSGDDDTVRPSAFVEGALFRIAHEAIINAARHSAAKSVLVHVSDNDNRTNVAIRDDGHGFDLLSTSSTTGHWGLKNMRERARAVGGSLIIETAPGKGTVVTAEVPRRTA